MLVLVREFKEALGEISYLKSLITQIRSNCWRTEINKDMCVCMSDVKIKAKVVQEE